MPLTSLDAATALVAALDGGVRPIFPRIAQTRTTQNILALRETRT